MKLTDIVIDKVNNEKAMIIVKYDSDELFGQQYLIVYFNPLLSYQVVSENRLTFVSEANSIEHLDFFRKHRNELFEREIYKYKNEHFRFRTLIDNLRDLKII